MDHSLKIKNKNKRKKTGDSRYIFQNELHKACYQHNMTSENFKDLNSRTAADKILRDKTFNIAKIKKYDGYESGFASTVLIFFDKKLQVVLFKKKLCKMTN